MADNQTTNNMKYPMDIVTLLRKKKTFSVTASFSPETDESPLKIFSKMSRLKFCILENKNAVTANLKTNQLEGIRMRSEYAFKAYMDRQFAPDDTTATNRPAFTVKFMVGENKGKSPADILRENGLEKGKEILNSQYKWLRDNLEKYPKNKTIMDAISDAAKLSPDEIGEKTAVASVPIPILSVIPKPIMSKQNNKGMFLVNELLINWDNSRELPVVVQITNYWAPVIKREDGTLNIQASQKDKSTENRFNFAMGADEWFGVLKEMEDCVSNYKQLHSSKAWNMATEAYINNINAYKAAHQQSA